MAISNEIMSIYSDYIDKHNYLPDFMKPEIKIIISRSLSLLSQYIGNIELTYRRTLDKGNVTEKKEKKT